MKAKAKHKLIKANETVKDEVQNDDNDVGVEGLEKKQYK